MKQSDGSTRPGPTIVAFIGVIASLLLLSCCLRSLALGRACLARTGIGAARTLPVGRFWFGERASVLNISAALIIVGEVVLMRLASSL